MNSSGLKPLGHAVILEPYEVEAVSKGGIVLPASARERDMLAEQRAIVVACGPCCWDDEVEPRALPGDKVMFSKYAGYIAVGPADEKKYRVVNDLDIFMQITAEKA